MKINVNIKTENNLHHVDLININLESIEHAIQSSYLGLGTSYDPIAVDSFSDFTENKFPDLPSKAEVRIKLKFDPNEAFLNMFQPSLTCLKIINVGREFNQKKLPSAFWPQVFDFTKGDLIAAPDKTLYAATTATNEIKVGIDNKLKNIYLRYSILFSVNIKIFHNEGYDFRRFYFIIDPLLHIRSNPTS